MAIVLSYRNSQTPAQMNWIALPLEIGLYGVVLDFWFYWYHRVMHDFDFLWKYHRTHHLTKHPNALLTLYADEEQEFFDVVGIPLMTYFTLKLMGLPMGFYEWWICQMYVVFTELAGHSGIRVCATPPSTLTWLLRYFDAELSIEDHDLHHRSGWKKSHNYGKQTRLWDRIFGTCHDRIELVKENIDYENTATIFVGLPWVKTLDQRERSVPIIGGNTLLTLNNQIQRHGPSIVSESMKAPELYKYLPFGPYPTLEDFERWYNHRITSTDGNLLYAITDLQLRPGEIAGVVGFSMGLLLQHALGLPPHGMGMRRVQWKAHPDNAKSVRAAERLGFIYEGILRWNMVLPQGKDGNDINVNKERIGNGVPGRHSVMLSFCCDDWEGESRDKLDLAMKR
ncbi:hypothetical protein FH972_024279 [Carpinus fangiana]|uniref:Fatty acid hydroxylase domain-containing protein n=1 Tax=Carpinus fangiana TaxID=176857 RepID=A0A5N6KXL8_9ROSI|nr:hypothetical protein FH972_024279 [Carpinus fangiana]